MLLSLHRGVVPDPLSFPTAIAIAASFCAYSFNRWEREYSRINDTSHWTAEEDAIIQNMRQSANKSSRSSAALFHCLPGRTVEAIQKRAAELQLGFRKKWSAEELEQLANARKEGKTWKEIAELVGRSTVACQLAWKMKISK